MSLSITITKEDKPSKGRYQFVSTSTIEPKRYSVKEWIKQWWWLKKRTRESVKRQKANDKRLKERHELGMEPGFTYVWVFQKELDGWIQVKKSYVEAPSSEKGKGGYGRSTRWPYRELRDHSKDEAKK